MPAVIASAPAGPPLTQPTNVAKITSGAGSTPASAIPSRNWASVIHPRPTVSLRTKGMAVYAPPNVSRPPFNPARNNAQGSGVLPPVANGVAAQPGPLIDGIAHNRTATDTVATAIQ